MAPVTDLPLLFSSSLWNLKPTVVARMKRTIGDPVADMEALRSKSPVYTYEKLTPPLLLVHGTEDVDVSFEHSWRLRSLLVNAGRPPAWLPLPGSDHSVSDAPGRLALHAASDRFLRECLNTQAPAGEGKPAGSGL